MPRPLSWISTPFIFTSTSLSVFVDDVLQMQIGGSFNDGRMGFYNFSQADVAYDAFTIDPAPTPTPTTVSLFLAGLAGLGAMQRRQH
jgi:hypothetical protein